MKKFWKMVLASALGILIASIALTILSIGFVGAIAGSGKTTPVVPQNAVLTIDLATMTVAEQTLEDNPFEGMTMGTGGFNMNEITTIGILDAVDALKKAAEDPCVKMVYLRPDYASGIAHMEELRAGLQQFRASGKPVIAYVENPTNGGMYLGSVADRTYMADFTGGVNSMIGLSGQLTFYKDLLDKLGINIQLIRHGKFKSAGEGFIRNSASEENLMQNRVMIGSIWNSMTKGIVEENESLSAEKLNKMIDNLEFVTAQDFEHAGLADEVVSRERMKQILCESAGCDALEEIPAISLPDYATATLSTDYKIKDKIAVIYADGDIVDGSDIENVSGKRFADMICEVKADSSVKAVVLRVNSPGGSVIAATQIKEAIDELQKVKPVVASYGEYAASGGYWISAGCERIFSDETTLTGSIGVFGIFPDFGKTVKDIAHVNITAVPTNKHSDMFSMMRPLDKDESAYLQKDIEEVYTRFTSLVARGRDMSVESVDKLGQGRVWAGSDALQNGLVDEIGGLSDAIEYAASLCGCAQWRVEGYPQPLDMMEQMMMMFQQNSDKQDELVSIKGVGASTIKALRRLCEMDKPAVMARMPYEIAIR